MTAGSSRVIYQWDGGSVFSYLYAIDQNLILFDMSLESGRKVYSIKVIDTTDLSVQTIVSKEYCNGAGTYISCIDVDGETIYSYQISVADGSKSWLIAGYDLTGNVIVEYPLDLSTFLLNDNNETRDSIVRIKKINDYYILNTLQRRTRIWQEVNRELLPVSLPSDEFEGEDFLGEYAVAGIFGESDEIYFCTYGTEPSIYEFSTKTGEFDHYLLPVISNYSNYYINNGRLLIKNAQYGENGLQSNATYCLIEQLS